MDLDSETVDVGGKISTGKNKAKFHLEAIISNLRASNWLVFYIFGILTSWRRCSMFLFSFSSLGCRDMLAWNTPSTQKFVQKLKNLISNQCITTEMESDRSKIVFAPICRTRRIFLDHFHLDCMCQTRALRTSLLEPPILAEKRPKFKHRPILIQIVFKCKNAWNPPNLRWKGFQMTPVPSNLVGGRWSNPW
jgi:hypothetical protein